MRGRSQGRWGRFVPDPVQELPAKDAVDLEAAERYRTAVERRAAELVAEKLTGADVEVR